MREGLYVDQSSPEWDSPEILFQEIHCKGTPPPLALVGGSQGTSDGDHIAQQCLMITSSSKIGMTGHVLKMLILQLCSIRLKTSKAWLRIDDLDCFDNRIVKLCVMYCCSLFCKPPRCSIYFCQSHILQTLTWLVLGSPIAALTIIRCTHSLCFETCTYKHGETQTSKGET